MVRADFFVGWADSESRRNNYLLQTWLFDKQGLVEHARTHVRTLLIAGHTSEMKRMCCGL